MEFNSGVAQWKRAGPITQRTVDRNYSPLKFLIYKNNLMNNLFLFKMFYKIYFYKGTYRRNFKIYFKIF
jgi:hypothetical protein